MEVIITEKAIAGQRISSLLAGKQLSPKFDQKAQYFEFEKDGKQYWVIPLRGHITDVNFPKRYSNWIGTDLKELTKAEIEYVSSVKQITSFLSRVSSKADSVVVATDADREGEAIGAEALSAMNLVGSPKVKRAYFSAMTQQDINHAFSNLVNFDYNLADSADARREIDLVWGAVLTRFLSIVSGSMGKEFLSAGRVQSPTLALIVQREKEILAFNPKPFWELQALFEKSSKEFEALHKKGKFWKKEEADKALECKSESHGTVTSVSKKKLRMKKPVPFNTTALLRSAANIGFTVGGAMSIAESLYQSGYISYPRTDNSAYPKTLDLRDITEKLLDVKELKPLAEKILHQKTIEPSAGKSTKDHPPICPVSAVSKEKLGGKEWKIYELVCRRFLATLSEDALLESVSAEISLGQELFIARGKTILSAGWKEFYPYSKTKEVFLPELEKGETVKLNKLDLISKETKHPPRYSQGSLIKLMEQNSLGTKATRHNILQKLYARRYISGQKAITPNKIAFTVITALDKYEETIVKPKMTADLENEMDLVAAGKKGKDEVVETSRMLLLSGLEKLLTHKNDVGSELRKALRDDSIICGCTQEGCGGELVIRKARVSGKRFLGCSNYPKCTESYPLPQTGKILSTDKLCEQCGKPMIKVLNGRRSFEMCIDMNCPSKDEWKKKSAERAEKAKQSKSSKSVKK